MKTLELSDIYRLTLKRDDYLIHAIETKSEKWIHTKYNSHVHVNTTSKVRLTDPATQTTSR